MALAASSLSVLPLKLPYKKSRMILQVRAQNYEDEGIPSSRHNLVDANMRILINRIEEIKMKEKLERRYDESDHLLLGWNYAHCECDCFEVPYSRPRMSSPKPFKYIELVGTVGGTFSLTILSGTLGLCLASLLVHINQL